MSATLETARDVFIVGLRNQHAVENQAIELLERQIGRLKDYPEMIVRMREHLSESKEQAHRIENILASFGTRESSLKDVAQSLLGNVMAFGHSASPDEVMKTMLSSYAFENYEVAAYAILLTLADLLGDESAKQALNVSLREEERMAQWIADQFGPTTLRYVERSAAGLKAGV